MFATKKYSYPYSLHNEYPKFSLTCFKETVSRPENQEDHKNEVLPDICNIAIFMLQTINVGGKQFNLFYDIVI